MSNRSTNVVILALLVGFAGLGLGSYAAFIKAPESGPAGHDGTDGVDAPGYYCTSQAEVLAALTTIGAGDGCITIMTDIVLDQGIGINQTGSYIIRGVSPDITLVATESGAISITSVESCIIRDLTINASRISSGMNNIIYIQDTNVRIENVHIFGDADRLGCGIFIDDDKVWVSNCYINSIAHGIWAASGTINAHISANTIENCWFHGIIIESNLTIVSDNFMYQNWYASISAWGDNGTYTGNIIVGTTISFVSYINGIHVGGDYNVVTGNSITSVINSHGSYAGYGMRISGAINTIVGNMMLGNEVNYSDIGTGTVASGNNYT